MTSHTGDIVRTVIMLTLIGSGVAYVVFRSIKKADDPARVIFKWVLTAVTVFIAIRVGLPEVSKPDLSAMYGLAVILICAFALIVTWRHNLAGLVADPIGSLYDGGTTPPDPHPAYSVAMARQKQGRYLEAVAEIRKQLDRFPTDVEGQLLLAQIQAEDLKDLPAAEMTIQHFCEQPHHAPQNVVFALYSLADWHLKIGKDREAARRDLEKIIALLPDSEFALGASHRIAHLGGAEMLLPPSERRKFVVAEGAHNVGLMRNSEHLRPAEVDPGQVAADYVKHLEQHPLDTEAREKLAIIYTDHYGRLDLATDQLEQLIQEPNQPAKLVVHWLNLLADLQIRSGAAYDTIRETLQRIIDLDPAVAAAEVARRRLNLLKLELKGKQNSQDVKLGSYEQKIGLTRERRASG
jgi:tetratricopeptide (TPR) repeat protein